MRLVEPCAPDGNPALAWRILIVEGDTEQADNVGQQLRRHGHDVQHVQTGDAALRLAPLRCSRPHGRVSL